MMKESLTAEEMSSWIIKKFHGFRTGSVEWGVAQPDPIKSDIDIVIPIQLDMCKFKDYDFGLACNERRWKIGEGPRSHSATGLGEEFGIRIHSIDRPHDEPSIDLIIVTVDNFESWKLATVALSTMCKESNAVKSALFIKQTRVTVFELLRASIKTTLMLGYANNEY